MKISIVIPVYNGEKTLRRALDSAVSQGADEVVVIDDASTDSTPDILAEYPTLTVHRHPAKSEDHCKAMEPIIEAMDADYVIGLGADDWLYDGMVASVRRALGAAQGEPGVVLCEFDHVAEDGRLLRTNRYSPVRVEFTPETYRAYIANHTMRAECGVAAAFRRNLLIWMQREGYASLGPWCDCYSALLCGLRAGAIYVPGPLAAFTSRADSYSGTAQKDPVWRDKCRAAAEAFLTQPSIMPLARGIKFRI